MAQTSDRISREGSGRASSDPGVPRSGVAAMALAALAVLAALGMGAGVWFSRAEQLELTREIHHVVAAGKLQRISRHIVAESSGSAALEGRAGARRALEAELEAWTVADPLFAADLIAAESSGQGGGSDLQRAHARLAEPLAVLRAAVDRLRSLTGDEVLPRAELEAVSVAADELLVRMEGLALLHEEHIEQLATRARRIQYGVWIAGMLLVLVGARAVFGRRRAASESTVPAVPDPSVVAAPDRALEPQLPALVAHALEGIVTATGDGSITAVNPAAARMFGIPARELIGKPLTLLEAHAPGTEREGVLAAFLRLGDDELTGELRVLRRGGTLFPAETSIVRVREDGAQFLLLVLREISERARTMGELEADAAHQRQLNRELEARARALEEAGKRVSELETQVRHGRKLEAVGRLAGGIAHDFNNILSVLLCSNNRLRSVLATAEVPAELVEEPLEEIHRACWRAATLTRQLLDFSRRQVLHPQVLSPATLLEGLEGMLRSALTEDIAFRISTAEGIPNLRADPVHIEQVLVNLVLNARDAQEGAGEIRVEADCVELEGFVDHDAEAHTGRYVRFRVTDTGTGIGEDVLDLIFEPFFTTKPVGEGTGLGLASARGIVKQSGGFMAVESELGRGSTFDVYVPAVDEAVSDGTEEPEESEGEGSGTILLCEDDVDLLRVTARTLQRGGYDVISASPPERALEQATGRDVDLLVTDLVMPGMSGRDLAERLRSEREGLAIVYISGYTEDVLDSHVGLDRGEDVLTKPYAAADLLGRVRDALGARSA